MYHKTKLSIFGNVPSVHSSALAERRIFFLNSKGKPKKQKAKNTKSSKLTIETAFIGQLNTAYTFLYKKKLKKRKTLKPTGITYK